MGGGVTEWGGGGEQKGGGKTRRGLCKLSVESILMETDTACEENTSGSCCCRGQAMPGK